MSRFVNSGRFFLFFSYLYYMEKKNELLEAAKPLMDYLKRKGSPYYYAIVTQVDIEIVESQESETAKEMVEGEM